MRNKFFQEILDNTPRETEIFVELYADLVARVQQLMDEKGWTQKELAAKMGKQPSEISKWLSGEHNFTLRSIAKLSAELNESLLQVSTGRSGGTFQGSFKVTTMTWSIHRRVKEREEGEIQWTGKQTIPVLSHVG